MTALHSCLSCRRHPSTHAPATPDSDDGCPMCGLGDERADMGECPRCGEACPIGDGDCPSASCTAFRAWAATQPQDDEPSPGPSLVCTETLPDGSQPIRLSFAIKVF